VNWLTAIRLLCDCPAILRVGVRAICFVAECIDEGRDELARDSLDLLIRRRTGEAAGRAAKASSDATKRKQ